MLEAESEGLPVDGAPGVRVGYLVRRRVALSSDDALYYLCGHVEEAIGNDWQNEPFNLELTLRKGRVSKYRKFNRLVEAGDLPHGKALPDPVASDVLFLFLPVWPLTNHPGPHEGSLGLIGVVQEALSSGKYARLSGRHSVGGEWCAEIRSRSGHDTMWVSEAKELCLMRREWRSPITGKVVGRIVTRRTAEVTPGLWMPVEIECFRLSPSSPGGKPEVRSRIVTRVLRWSFGDDVPREVFQAALKPGTIEIPEPGRIRQVSSGGMELLDEVAAYGRGPLALPQSAATSSGNWHAAVWIAVGLAGGVGMGLVLFSTRSRA